MDVKTHVGGRLDESQVNFFRAFGYLVFRGLLRQDEVAELGTEFVDAIAEQYHDKPLVLGADDERDRRQWAIMIDADTPRHASLLEDERILPLARQLCGDDVIGIKVQADRFGGGTPWHRDTYTAKRGGVKFLAYHEPVHRLGGALRVIPVSHLLGDDYLFAEKLRRTAPADVPSEAIDTEPGDVIAFDMRIWHGAVGGQERRATSVTYYNNPRTDDEEEALRLRAFTNVEILMQRFGCTRQYFYSQDWLRNDAGSEVRGWWIRRLGEVGYLDAPGVVEPAAPGQHDRLTGPGSDPDGAGR